MVNPIEHVESFDRGVAWGYWQGFRMGAAVAFAGGFVALLAGTWMPSWLGW